MQFTEFERNLLTETVKDCFNTMDMKIEDCGSDLVILLPMENLEVQFRTYTNREFSSLLIRWVADRPEDERKIHAYVEYDEFYFDQDVWRIVDFLQDRDQELEYALEALNRNLERELKRLHRI